MSRSFDSGRRCWLLIYFILHYNHIRELTKEAIQAIKLVQRAGVATVNQTPIINKVNDNVEALSELFAKLSFVGAVPYYVFNCRPTEGNLTYAVPVEKAFKIFSAARAQNSGLAKTSKFVMSYKMGKIEVLGIVDGKVYLKKHNWYHYKENEEIEVFNSNPEAYWYDDYEEVKAAMRMSPIG